TPHPDLRDVGRGPGTAATETSDRRASWSWSGLDLDDDRHVSLDADLLGNRRPDVRADLGRLDRHHERIANGTIAPFGCRKIFPPPTGGVDGEASARGEVGCGAGQLVDVQ